MRSRWRYERHLAEMIVFDSAGEMADSKTEEQILR